MLNQCHIGDCRELLKQFAAAGVRAQMCVTSPPYFGLRDYGHPGQIGLEPTPSAYVEQIVAVFAAVRDVLADDGTLWLNLGDSYNAYNGGAGPSSKLSRGAQTTQRPQLPTGYGLKVKEAKPKDLLGIPWRVAFALQADGWYLRSDIIWHKPNPMPESVTDRPTKAHEYLFLLAKSERYYYDAESIAEPHSRDWSGGKSGGSLGPNGKKRMELKEGDPNYRNGHSQWEREAYPEPRPEGRNRRSVWTVSTQPFDGAHFATFPRTLIEPCILAGALENVRSSIAKFASDSGKQITEVLISSNVSLGEQRPADPGVAVYFTWDQISTCIAVDRYQKVEDNLQAIHHVIEAERTKLRHGGLNLVRAAFRGYAALPPPQKQTTRPWNMILGVPETATLDAIESAYKRLRSSSHPDKGGSPEQFNEVQRAYDQALHARGN